MSLGDLVGGLEPGAQVVAGTVASTSPLRAIVRGAAVDCLLVAPYSPSVGDQVAVAVSQGVYRILGWVSNASLPRTATVTATTVSGKPGFIAVVEAGVTWHVQAGATFAVNDVVAVLWQSSTGIAVAKVGAVTPPSPPGQTNPGGAPSGRDTFPTLDTASWNGGRWRTDTDNVMQGEWESWGLNYGAAFYGGAFRSLAGATVTGAALFLPRYSGGGANAPQTLHLYRHTSDLRPSGDVSRVAGPFDVTSPARGGSAWVAIPTSLIQACVDSGGGLGIAGNPYVIIQGRSLRADTFSVVVDWRRF